jgi:hypothetical protein
MVATTLDQGGSQSAQVSWDVLTAWAERIGYRRRDCPRGGRSPAPGSGSVRRRPLRPGSRAGTWVADRRTVTGSRMRGRIRTRRTRRGGAGRTSWNRGDVMPGVVGELGEERSLGAAVALAEWVQAVDVSEEPGQSGDERVAGQARNRLCRAELRVGAGGLSRLGAGGPGRIGARVSFPSPLRTRLSKVGGGC